MERGQYWKSKRKGDDGEGLEESGELNVPSRTRAVDRTWLPPIDGLGNGESECEFQDKESGKMDSLRSRKWHIGT